MYLNDVANRKMIAVIFEIFYGCVLFVNVLDNLSQLFLNDMWLGCVLRVILFVISCCVMLLIVNDP